MLIPILNRIYEISAEGVGKRDDVALTATRSSLVALNIITQKLIKVKNLMYLSDVIFQVLNATHTSRIVSQACTYISDGRAPVRILAIRLLRVLVQKMPEFGVQQYRELILFSVFEGQLTPDLTNKVSST